MSAVIEVSNVSGVGIILEVSATQPGFLVEVEARPAETLYFDGDVDADWDTVGNWWAEETLFQPAGRIPASVDSVVAFASVTASGQRVLNFTMSDPSQNAPALSGSLAVTGVATFNDGAENQANITGNAVFNDASRNTGDVSGSATFNGTSCNSGTAGVIVGSPPACNG